MQLNCKTQMKIMDVLTTSTNPVSIVRLDKLPGHNLLLVRNSLKVLTKKKLIKQVMVNNVPHYKPTQQK